MAKKICLFLYLNFIFKFSHCVLLDENISISVYRLDRKRYSIKEHPIMKTRLFKYTEKFYQQKMKKKSDRKF